MERNVENKCKNRFRFEDCGCGWNFGGSNQGSPIPRSKMANGAVPRGRHGDLLTLHFRVSLTMLSSSWVTGPWPMIFPPTGLERLRIRTATIWFVIKMATPCQKKRQVVNYQYLKCELKINVILTTSAIRFGVLRKLFMCVWRLYSSFRPG